MLMVKLSMHLLRWLCGALVACCSDPLEAFLSGVPPLHFAGKKRFAFLTPLTLAAKPERSRLVDLTTQAPPAQAPETTKALHIREGLLSFIGCLAVSYSHMGSPTLPSALTRFTSEFGMGSGGTTLPLPPSKFFVVN